MDDQAYISSVLRCNISDDECAICRFLNGDRSDPVLLHVIALLDKRLAEEESYSRTITESFRMLVAESK